MNYGRITIGLALLCGGVLLVDQMVTAADAAVVVGLRLLQVTVRVR